MANKFFLYKYEEGDIVTMKKAHPCGSKDWLIKRIGADAKLCCQGDENDIYYLMSRGLSRTDAEKLVVYGFFNPYLANVKDENILAYIKKIIENKLENKNE